MNKISLFVGTALAISLGAGAAYSQSPAPDNTKANAVRENSTNKTSTADGQYNDATDLALTQKIRKSVMADKTLSTYAHNVKIVSVHGEVTLNGVVRDAHEKAEVAMKAEAVAGRGKVTNDMTVTSGQ